MASVHESTTQNAGGVANDPRAKPAMVQVLQSVGFGGHQSSGDYGTDLSKIEPVLAQFHEGFVNFYETLPNDLPGDAAEPEIIPTTVSIDGVDGNKIDLYIWKQARMTAGERRPGVVYFHGGGMTVLNTRSKPTDRWCKSLALRGLVVVMVDFRNAWMPGKHNPFPAGLNDCASAVRYVHAHKSELNISKVIVEGESGGGTLALATALKANREGWTASIDGVYAHAPMISAAYDWPVERKQELPTLISNEGLFLDMHATAAFMRWYTPDQLDRTNPLAWPYHASSKDLRGLPPHIICTDELDFLCSEGEAYFRKLQEADVKAEFRMNKGVVHCTDVIFRKALPEEHEGSVKMVAEFAKSL